MKKRISDMEIRSIHGEMGSLKSGYDFIYLFGS